MDYSGLHALNRFALGNDWFEDPVRVFGQLSEVIFVALLAALFLGRGRWGSQSARRAAIAAGFAAVLGLAIAHGVTMIWDRPRPFEAHPGLHMFVARSGDPSFPSDHATAAFAIAVSVLLRNRRIGLVVLALAVAVALSRLVVGAHYPSDVIGGALVGSGAALILWTEPLRSLIDRLADRLGSIYERGAVRVARTPGR